MTYTENHEILGPLNEAKITNPLNPGGIEPTLKRWYENEDPNLWIIFDGVTVKLVSNLDLCCGEKPQWRSLSKVWELSCLFREDGHKSIDKYLYCDY